MRKRIGRRRRHRDGIGGWRHGKSEEKKMEVIKRKIEEQRKKGKKTEKDKERKEKVIKLGRMLSGKKGKKIYRLGKKES